MRTRIKICGITRMQDGRDAVEAGADALGFIFWRPSPRFIEPARAAPIVHAAGPFVSTVGVFVNPSREEVEATIALSGVSMLQFHGEEPASFCASFERPWIKAFKVGQGGDLVESLGPYGAAAGWLFDAFDERLVGGTGEPFDWRLLPKDLDRPLILSGGLNVDNVGDAVRRLRPFAVDVSSGVEVGKGIKDAGRIRAFIQGVTHAGQ